MWKHFFLIGLFLFPCLIQMFSGIGNNHVFVNGEDEIIDEDVQVEEPLSGQVNDETTDNQASDTASQDQPAKTGEDDDEEGEVVLKPSPNAITSFLFVKPFGFNDIPAGRESRVLIGFTNEGEKDFVVETLEASLRYPQDFSYYIQNFTTYRLYQTIEPQKEATFDYRFVPSESLSSRPFGLVITVNYKDGEGGSFRDAIFNSTINIAEPDEGMDGEIVFMYIFLLAVVVLAGIGITHLFGSIKKKHLGSKPKQLIELGTQNKNDVDYDWLPKETLHELKKSPKASPKASPRLRR